MASGIFDSIKKSDGSLDWDDNTTTTIKIALVGTGFTFDDTVAAASNLATALSTHELSGPGYVRAEIVNRTITVDTNTTPHTARHMADNPATYTGANFGEVKGGIVYKEVAGGDANCIPLVYSELDSSVVTNGGDFTFQFSGGVVFNAQ